MHTQEQSVRCTVSAAVQGSGVSERVLVPDLTFNSSATLTAILRWRERRNRTVLESAPDKYRREVLKLAALSQIEHPIPLLRPGSYAAHKADIHPRSVATIRTRTTEIRTPQSAVRPSVLSATPMADIHELARSCGTFVLIVRRG